MRPFRFAVQSFIAPTMPEWRDRARRAEDLGYSALYVSDHLDSQFAPLIAATVAAEATTTLHIGTLMLNNDLRNPVVLAKEIATLGLAAEGRIEVGLGAGWLRSDYEATGIELQEPAVRVDRLAESISVMRALWEHGEATFEGDYVTAIGAVCDPRPAAPPRIMVGGGSKRILTLAAKQADMVGIGPNLASGMKGNHAASLLIFEHYERCLGWVRDAADDRFDSLELQLAAIAVVVVASERAAVRTASMLALPPDDALDLPVVLIGTVEDLCVRLQERRERWGFSTIVVPDESMVMFAPVVARLAGK